AASSDATREKKDLTDMVVYKCHVPWAKRDRRSIRKTGERRRGATGFGTERGRSGAGIGSPTRSFRTAGAALRGGGQRFGLKGSPQAEGRIHSEATRRPGQTAEAPHRDKPSHAEFFGHAGSRGVLSQDAYRVAPWRIDESKSTTSSTGWARITSSKPTEYSFPSGASVQR